MTKLNPASTSPEVGVAGATGHPANPSPLPVPRSPRYRTLDTWRGLACLMVVVFHSFSEDVHANDALGRAVEFVVRKLWAGVPMFFVISGYCIAATSDSSRRKRGATNDFFKRRLRRIFPPYWIFLALSAAAIAGCGSLGMLRFLGEPAPLPDPAQLTVQQWLGTVTLTEPIRPHFFADPFKLFMGHAWTLCYEEQFYMVCGLLLLLAPRRFFRGILFVTVLTLLVMPFSFKKVGFETWGFFFDGRWLNFAAGVLVYYQVNYASKQRSRLVGALLAAGVAGTLLFYRWLLVRHAAGSVGAPELGLGFELVVGSIFAALLSLLHRWDRTLQALPFLRPISFCGTICYSLYLVHLPFTSVIAAGLYQWGLTNFWGSLLVTVPLGVLASVASGWLFHVCVERYFLNPPTRILSPQGVKNPQPVKRQEMAVISSSGQVV